MFSLKTFGQTENFSGLFNSLKSEVDAEKMESLLKKMETMAAQEPSRSDGMILDASGQYTAIAFAELGNRKKAMIYVDKIKDASWREPAMVAVARKLNEINKPKEAKLFISEYLNNSKTALTPLSVAAKKALEFQYGVLLYQLNSFAESLKYLSIPTKNTEGAESEYYPLALFRAGEMNKAYLETNKVFTSGVHRSRAFDETSKLLFQKVTGNGKRFDFLIDSLKKADEQKINNKIMKMAVNKPAPDFELTDLNGKRVSLQSLKGKTIIIDFWATWCIPCVGSFPGMQKAVEYYKGDSSVVFLFVHSYDKGPTAMEDAKKIIQSKNYTFDVYMDFKDKSTGQSPVAALFNVTMLPTKLVIDQKGIIRFRNSGYITVDEAIPEISAMVEKSRS